MKKLRNKVIATFIVMMFAFMATVGTTYAYWVSIVNAPIIETQTPDVIVGSGEDVIINVIVSETNVDTKVLVPTGRVIDINTQTDSITVEYTVIWVEDTRLNGVEDANINAVVSNIQVNGVANPFTLVQVIPGDNPTTIAHKSIIIFTFVVTLNEPADLEQYDAVAGKTITFDINFTVSPN